MYLTWTVANSSAFAEPIKLETGHFASAQPKPLCKLNHAGLEAVAPFLPRVAPHDPDGVLLNPTCMRLPETFVEELLQGNGFLVTPLAYAKVAWGPRVTIEAPADAAAAEDVVAVEAEPLEDIPQAPAGPDDAYQMTPEFLLCCVKIGARLINPADLEHVCRLALSICAPGMHIRLASPTERN